MGKKRAILVAALILIPLSGFTQDITLVKYARRVESIETARYTVQKGDTLWKIFLKSFEAKKEDMPYLYKKFRELNPRVKDLNRILAGQKLVIPRMPEQGKGLSVKAASDDIYVIKKGQHLAMVLREVYGLSDDLIFNEYLDLIKELNPGIEDINLVEPGQAIRMPKKDDIVSAVERLEKKHDTAREIMPEIPVMPKKAQIIDSVEASQDEPLEEAMSTGPELVEEVVIKEQPEEMKIDVVEDIPDAEVESTTDQVVSMKMEPIAESDPQAAVKSAPAEVVKTEKKEVPQKETFHEKEEKTAAAEVIQSEPKEVSKRGTLGEATIDEEKRQLATRLVRNTLMPALTSMGGRQKDQGTYFMPMSGGSSISIDTSEVPVMELDTGRRIIMDVNNKISDHVKDLLEKTFPSCTILSGPSGDIESLMDRVLNVSGYFSINKNASPLLVGEEEKVRFSGKWIVYKDYTRHNVFVVNILSEKDQRTPETIRRYASRFGIDMIELGGRKEDREYVGSYDIKSLGHSYQMLFDETGIAYESDKILDLVAVEAIKITYKAPIIVGDAILTKDLPDDTMLDLLRSRRYTVIHTAKAPLEDILKILAVEIEGPPVKVVIAEGRSEMELPALKVRDAIILLRSIDRDIGAYLASQGRHVLMW
ncbi:MAG TPA: LysM peptidoglycan-binding domain-containing protein [Deltaproteobacteria bacterium]|nr:LysM peptidoglycan-binding domain-containing protein [Deltaproteobacteria bacterium]